MSIAEFANQIILIELSKHNLRSKMGKCCFACVAPLLLFAHGQRKHIYSFVVHQRWIETLVNSMFALHFS